MNSDIHVVAGAVVKEISKEEGACSLIPSSTMLRVHFWLKLVGPYLILSLIYDSIDERAGWLMQVVCLAGGGLNRDERGEE